MLKLIILSLILTSCATSSNYCKKEENAQDCENRVKRQELLMERRRPLL